MKQPKSVIGLVNEGNTCYMNAALQNLINIEPLRTFAESVYGRVYFKKDSVGDRFSSLVHDLNGASSLKKSIHPVAFCMALTSMKFREGVQEDAGEFISEFISKLSDENDIEASDYAGVVKKLFEHTLQEIKWDDALAKNQRMPVVNVDSGIVLSLPLLTDGGKRTITNLENALYAYFSPEEVDVVLINGKKAGSPMKKLAFETLPPYLVINLMRFRNDMSKLQHPVSFPERLTITYLSEQSPDRNNNSYKLLGVVLHSGSIESGHYTAYVRRGNVWYFCDDARVEKISSQEIANTMQSGNNKHGTPYILFYENTKKKGALPEPTAFAERVLPIEEAAHGISSQVRVLNRTGKDLYVKLAPYSRWRRDEASDKKPLWVKIGNKAAYSENLFNGIYPQLFLTTSDPEQEGVMLTWIKLDPRDEYVVNEKRRDVIVEVTKVGDNLVIKPQKGTWISLKKETEDKVSLKYNISSSNDLIIKTVRSSDLGISQPNRNKVEEFVKSERKIDPHVILREVAAAYKFKLLSQNATEENVRKEAMKEKQDTTDLDVLGFKEGSKPTIEEIRQKSDELLKRLKAILEANYGDNLMVDAINRAIVLLKRATINLMEEESKAVGKIRKGWNAYKKLKQGGYLAYTLLTEALGKKINKASTAWEKLGMTREAFGDLKKRTEKYQELESRIQGNRKYSSDVISQALDIIETAYGQERQEDFGQKSDMAVAMPVSNDYQDESPFSV